MCIKILKNILRCFLEFLFLFDKETFSVCRFSRSSSWILAQPKLWIRNKRLSALVNLNISLFRCILS